MSFQARLAVWGVAAMQLAALFLSAQPASAAASCCLYTPETSKGAPEWIMSLGEHAWVFRDAEPDGSCAGPGQVVGLVKYSQFYPEGAPLGLECKSKDNADLKQAKSEWAAAKCCVVRDSNDKAIKCQPAAKNPTDGCLMQTIDSLGGSQKVFAVNQECKQLQECAEAAANDIATTAQNALPFVSSQGIQAQNQPTAGSSKKPEWTKAECLSFKDKNGSPRYFWNPPPQNPTAQSGDYCYISERTTNLQVDIGEVNQVVGLNRYINVAYRWFVGAAIVAIVVLLMVAGLQWMLSGVAQTIETSKSIIKNCIIGLLLLIGAHTLLNTINPQLALLRLPPMKAIRPVVFEQEKKPNCDPGDKNYCANKFGNNFYCKPTIEGFKKYCSQQTATFLGTVFAIGAAPIAGAMALEAGAGAVVSGGFRQVVSKVALEAAKSEVAGKVGQAVGDALGPAVLTAAGLYAASQISDALDGPPPLGECVQASRTQEDGQLCSYDHDCKAGSVCLLTKNTCGNIQNYGVCVSGKLRQPCSPSEEKYGCKQGSCVMNGQGVENLFTINVGFCSDGTELGMACNASAKCQAGKKLECIQGYCRDAGYYDEDGNIKTYEATHPRCVLPTECHAHGNKDALVPEAACLKPRNFELGLPARLVVANKSGPITSKYYQELTTQGVCVPYNLWGKAEKGPCYVNIFASKSDNAIPSLKLVQEMKKAYVTYDLAGKYGNTIKPVDQFPAVWEAGFGLNSVGCGHLSTGNPLSCNITMAQLWHNNLVISESGQASILGTCVNTNYSQNKSGTNNVKLVELEATKEPALFVGSRGEIIEVPIFASLNTVFAH